MSTNHRSRRSSRAPQRRQAVSGARPSDHLPGRIDELTDVVARLSAATALDQVTSTVTTAVRDLLGADGATFVMREDDLCYYLDEDAIAPLWQGQRFPAGLCVSGWVMEHGRTVSVPDVYADERIPQDVYRPTFVRAMAMAPVRAEDPIAAVGAYWASRYRHSPRELAILAALADAAAAALASIELRAQLHQQMAELAELISHRESLETAMHRMVHDLRSPMSALDTYATLLASGDIDADHVSEIAEKMRASVQGMGSRMDRILALDRLDHQPVNLEDIDLTDLATSIAREVRHRTGAYDVDLRIERGLRVRMDPVLAQLMIENLLENAYKYTSRREDPVVHVRRADDAAPAAPPGMVWLAVEDNGIGFDPARATALFAAHVRLETASAFSGTGLGLASVARVVELHGGQVRATGTPGGGAIFSFLRAGRLARAGTGSCARM